MFMGHYASCSVLLGRSCACLYIFAKGRRSVGDTNVTLALMAEGWHTYQTQLCEALAPLTAEQLAQRPAPHLRSIEELTRHIIGVRAGWFHVALGEGVEEFGAYRTWEQADGPVRTASELVQGLEGTLQFG
jgi:Protein of unknown function (DUF664)